MSSSGRRKLAVRHPAVVDMDCSCRRPRLLPSFMSSSSLPKAKPSTTPSAFSPTTSTTTTTTTATTSSSLWEASLTAAATTSTTTASSPSRYYHYISSPAVSDPQSPTSATTTTTTARGHERIEKDKERKKKKGLVEESLAVVKESSDPYADFRDSMLQMIVEMDIYAWDDLLHLLRRFLALNSPRHHHLIISAFAEVWRALFSVHSSSPSPSSPAGGASSSLAGRRL